MKDKIRNDAIGYCYTNKLKATNSNLNIFAAGHRSRDPEIEQLKEARLIDFDDEVREILGRPNFTCINIANRLREKGYKIENKSEDEQANVLYWMLSMYVRHGKQWKQEGETYLKEALKESK